MEKISPFPVTEENFTQCWEYVDKRCRAVRRKAVIAKIGGFTINLLFLLLLIIFASGLISEQLGGTFRDFVQSLFFFPVWEKVTSLLLTPGSDLYTDITKLLAADYVISAAAFALLAGLVWLVYHPFKEKLPTGTYEENLACLAKKAQDGRDRCYKTRLSTSIVATVLAIIAAFALLFAYALYLQDVQLIMTLLTTFPFKDPQTNCLLYVLFLYIFSNILCSVLLFLTRPLYRYEFPYELVDQTKYAVILARETEEGLTPEELDAKFKERAVAIREEAMEMEKAGAYGKARDLYLEAAILSDVAAMEHYARLCLLSRMSDSARYWLKKCVASEEASPKAKKMLLRMRLGLRHNLEYLKPEEAPPTTAMKIKRVLLTTISVIWKTLVLAMLVASIWVCYTLFNASTDPAVYDKLPDSMEELLTELKSTLSGEEDFPVEEVSPFETPVMTLTDVGTPWEGNCIAYDENGAPVVFCYGKDIGGDLKAAYNIGPEGSLRSAGVYVGNVWDVRSIMQFVTYLPSTQTVVISQDYLMTLAPGEYFIILDNSRYLPLLVSETTTFNSTQRGFAAQGHINGWIINDIQDPQDITLSFYNLGDNPIRTLSELVPLIQVAAPAKTPMDPQYYTISPDGSSVTISKDYWATRQVGSYVGFQVRLANGDILDTGYTYVGTVKGEFTGLMNILGEEKYSLSADGDYTAKCHFELPGNIMYLSVSTDAQPNVIEDNLSGMMSDFIDLDSNTVTLPADVLKPYLTAGEFFHIGISYGTSHGQNGYAQISVQVVK